MPASLTDAFAGVMRGRGVLLGRMRRDSQMMAERYGSSSSVAAEGRCWSCRFEERELDGSCISGAAEAISLRSRHCAFGF